MDLGYLVLDQGVWWEGRGNCAGACLQVRGNQQTIRTSSTLHGKSQRQPLLPKLDHIVFVPLISVLFYFGPLLLLGCSIVVVA